MADITLVIDPDDTSFALHDYANGRRLLGFDAPVPETDSQWAYSADTEGERRANLRYRNRTITASVMLDRSTAALLEALENTLGQKIGKLAREGGELRFGYPTGTTITFNVLEASFTRLFDIADMARFRARYEISFVCEPFGLGAEEDLGDNTETTLPCLVFTEASVKGDVPALGRLVIDDDSGFDQGWLVWGIETDTAYTHTSSSGSGALFYEAESRTVMGSATAVAGPSGASGGGSNVVRHTSLGIVDQAILSTQATGGGSHLSHVGTFRVFARVQVPTTNVGDVTLSFAWSTGDFRAVTVNAGVTIDEDQWVSSASWRLVDLGIVTLAPPKTGTTQRWEGRVLARSTTSGDDVDIDYLMFVPVGVASGEVSATIPFQAPSSYSARDEFNQAVGALTGETLPVGGTWAGAGDADDFQNSGTTAYRTAVSDTTGEAMANGRLAIAGTTTYTNIFVEAFGTYTTPGSLEPSWGTFARYTDASNWLCVLIEPGDVNSAVSICKRVAGTTVVLASVTIPGNRLIHPPGTTVGTRLQADDQGRVFAWVWTQGQSPGQPLLQAQHSDLATGGTIATGKIGFFDFYPGSPAVTRTYDNFAAAVPVKDAAVFASQSIEIGPSAVMREDSAGAIWARVSSYKGDYGRVLPSGAESRSNRVIIKGARNDPYVMPDGAIDDISARLFVTPRYLVVPKA